MTVHKDISTAEAEAIRATAQAMGETILFDHRSAGDVTLEIEFISDTGADILDLGRHDEEVFLEVLIPTGQVGFSASTSDARPVTAGDKITYEDREYFVVPDGIVKDPGGKWYRVRAQQRKSKTLGALS